MVDEIIDSTVGIVALVVKYNPEMIKQRVADGLEDIYNDPDKYIRQAKGLGNTIEEIISHPKEFGAYVVNEIKKSFNSEIEKDPYKRGQFTGRAAVFVASLFIGVGEARALSKVERAAGKADDIAEGVDQVIEGTGELGRFAKKPLNQSDFIGTLDEGFANLSTSKKIDAAFGEIESTFGKSYTSKIRELYNSSSQNFIKSDDDLGVFKLDIKGNPIIEINKNIGNSKVMANTILHEVRHLRQYNKLGISPKEWNEFSDEFVERFATSTNLWQGKKMGLSPEDLGIFENYYNGWRGNK